MNKHKCLKITCWVFFAIHFIFIITFHGILDICIAKCDLVLDILMLIALNSVGLFMTLSESHGITTGDYTFYKNAMFFSFLNIIFIILSIVYIVINFFIIGRKEKEETNVPIIKPFFENYLAELDYEKSKQNLIAIILIFFKTLETTPFFLLLHNYIKNIKSNKINIDNSIREIE